MATCESCETAISGPGHFVVDGERHCRRCYNEQATQPSATRATTRDPHAAKRSRERIITNEAGR